MQPESGKPAAYVRPYRPILTAEDHNTLDLQLSRAGQSLDQTILGLLNIHNQSAGSDVFKTYESLRSAYWSLAGQYQKSERSLAQSRKLLSEAQAELNEASSLVSDLQKHFVAGRAADASDNDGQAYTAALLSYDEAQAAFVPLYQQSLAAKEKDSELKAASDAALAKRSAVQAEIRRLREVILDKLQSAEFEAALTRQKLAIEKHTELSASFNAQECAAGEVAEKLEQTYQEFTAATVKASRRAQEIAMNIASNAAAFALIAMQAGDAANKASRVFDGKSENNVSIAGAPVSLASV